MSKELKVILLVLLGVFLIIQFIPSEKPENEPNSDYDFFEANQVPQEVEALLRSACYDCHSQEVKFPWYSYIAPVKWLVNKDIRMGRTNLDFSKWYELDKKDKLKVISEIEDEVEIGSMPMAIYVTMHSDANLSPEDREKIIEWTEVLAEKVFEE